MEFRVTPPNPNGTAHHKDKHSTPLLSSGVALTEPPAYHQPTVFATDLPLRGGLALLYALQRFEIGGVRLARLLLAWLLLSAAIWATGILPGRWLGTGILLLLAVLLFVVSARQRGQDFVRFTPQPLRLTNRAPLSPQAKLPIYATGILNVEGKYRRYTCVPGIYRTFATGEHATFCLVRARNWLRIANWPADDVGMWYAFVAPASIQRVQWGQLTFGRTLLPAIAIDYWLTLAPGPRRKREQVRLERLYLAFWEVADGEHLLADLLHNVPDATALISDTPATAA